VIRVVLPQHLQTLAGVGREVEVDVAEPVTLGRVWDRLEAEFPTLRGTFRDPATQRRRAYVRFYACDEDLSHESPDTLLPQPVVDGHEPLRLVGAMAGG
jgi:molybdopterin synthase sulfur carrier subunit